ncbi:MAG: histidine kinase [Lysobacterales bacterium]
MTNSSPQPAAPWHPHWLSPLNLAAYITWLAVLLQSVPFAELAQPRIALGGAMLVLMLLSYLGIAGAGARSPQALARARLLVVVQALGALAACWQLRSGGPMILLIIVAGQAVALWPLRMAVAGLALANLIMAWMWSLSLPMSDWLLALLPMIGFQAFAGLTVHYATTAEAARLAQAHTHAELLATQQLLEDSARSGERLRLSRELHDVAGHKLTALILNLRLLRRDPALAGREEARVAEALAEELLADIRGVVSALRRHDGIDLAAAIHTLTAQIPGTAFAVSIDPALRLPDVASAEILLRCTQEGITNALRHARAGRIEIDCAQVDGQLRLQVRNDGSAPRTLRAGNGLTGMRERLAAVGGRLELRARPDGGAELIASLPVSA